MRLERITTHTKPADRTPSWIVVDAEGERLGRLASRIAAVLQGKHRADYSRHQIAGDFVIVTNAAKIGVSGNKRSQKIYYRHTGYVGHLRSRTLEEMLDRFPERVIEQAVKGMLPRNRLGRQMLRRLKVYAAGEHPHEAQVNAGQGKAKQGPSAPATRTRRGRAVTATEEAAAPAPTATEEIAAPASTATEEIAAPTSTATEEATAPAPSAPTRRRRTSAKAAPATKPAPDAEEAAPAPSAPTRRRRTTAKAAPAATAPTRRRSASAKAAPAAEPAPEAGAAEETAAEEEKA